MKIGKMTLQGIRKKISSVVLYIFFVFLLLFIISSHNSAIHSYMVVSVVLLFSVFFWWMIYSFWRRQKMLDTLRQSEAMYRQLIDQAKDAILILNPDGQIILANKAFFEMFGYLPSEIPGLNIIDTYIDEEKPIAKQRLNDAGKAINLRFERRMLCKDGSILSVEVNAVRLPDGSIQSIIRDFTEIKAVENELKDNERRFRFLNELGDATRVLVNSTEIMAVVARMLGSYLGVSRCAYAEVNTDGEHFAILHDYVNGCASTVGDYKLSLFGPRAITELGLGRSLIINDVDLELSTGEGAEMFNTIGIKAIVCCPLMKNGVLRAMMAVHQAVPRRWRDVEISLIKEVVERCWAIIERARAEESLRESEIKYRNLVEQIPMNIYTAALDKLSTTLYISTYIEKIIGFTTSEYKADPDLWNRLIYPDDREKVLAALSKTQTELTPFNMEYRMFRRDGSIVWVHDEASILTGSTGQPLCLQGIMYDISERKKVEEALRNSEEMFKGVVSTVPIAIGVAADRKIEWANDRFPGIVGRGKDEIIGKDVRLLYSSDEEYARAGKQFYTELAKNGFCEMEVAWRHKNGSLIQVFLTGVTLNKQDASRSKVIFAAMDITERKNSEANIKLSELKFRGLFESMTSGVAMYETVDNGADFIFKDINPAVEKIEKIDRTQVIGKRVTEVFPGVKDLGLLEVFQRVWATGIAEYLPTRIYKDERILEAWRENWVYKIPGGEIVAVYNDVTQQKKLEQEIINADQRFMDVLNSSDDAILLIENNSFIDCNKATVKMLGYQSKGEFLMVHPSKLSPEFQPDGRNSVEKANSMMKIAAEKGFSRFEWVHTKANGENFPVDVSLTPISYKGRNVIHCLWRDITEIKKNEETLKNTQNQLIQSVKMASLGQLAGGVAHELNNPLTGVLNNVQLIKMEAELKKDFNLSDFNNLLGVVEESALRCKKITQSLLDFTHSSTGVFTKVSLNEVVKKTVYLVNQELKLQNILIIEELQPDLPQINGDLQLLQQVIYGLITNAKWAIDKKSNKGGTITIKTSFYEKNKVVEMSVADNGIGISPENINKLFTPFFTTKDVGEGTGLGLALFYNIIKSHGGEIKVKSQVNEGASFIINLPY